MSYEAFEERGVAEPARSSNHPPNLHKKTKLAGRPQKKRVAIVTNTGWNMVRFRGDLLKKLANDRWEVYAIADLRASDADLLRSWGVTPVPCKIQSSGTNPLRDAAYFTSLCFIYMRLRPRVIHHFSIKPVVYGSLAAKLCQHTAVVNSITGLGISYRPTRDCLSKVVRCLIKLALSGQQFAIFQNDDNRTQLVGDRILDAERSLVVPGSGVDTTALRPDYSISDADRMTFIMVSRMLWSKGVGEFVKAAERVKLQYPAARFLMFGGTREDYDSKNPDFVPKEWLDEVNRNGVVQWRGWTPPDEVEDRMRRCAAVVHPSYYPEGIPRTLIEAAAAGAPIITTNTPGCRDAVIDRVSGRLCPIRSPESLAKAMIELLKNPELIGQQGREGRRLAERKFDKERILEQILAIYDKIQSPDKH